MSQIDTTALSAQAMSIAVFSIECTSTIKIQFTMTAIEPYKPYVPVDSAAFIKPFRNSSFSLGLMWKFFAPPVMTIAIDGAYAVYNI